MVLKSVLLAFIAGILITIFSLIVNLIQVVMWLPPPKESSKRSMSTISGGKTTISSFKERQRSASNMFNASFFRWFSAYLIMIGLSIFGLNLLKYALPNPYLIGALSWPLSAPAQSSWPLTPSYLAVAWSPNDKYLAYANEKGKIQVLDTTSKHVISTYTDNKRAVYALAWSHDGKRIASGDDSGLVQVWDVTTGQKIVVYSGHTDIVYALAWSHDDAYLASASGDATVKVWDAINEDLINTFHSKTNVTSISWSHKGYYIVFEINGKGDTQVWDAISGNRVVTYTNPDPNASGYAAAWSPDDTRIASTSDNIVRIWDVATDGKTVSVVCSGHQDQVYTVAWSSTDLSITY